MMIPGTSDRRRPGFNVRPLCYDDIINERENMICYCWACVAFHEDFAPEFGPDGLPFEG